MGEPMGVPVRALLNAHGHRFGDEFYAPDNDKTWRLVGSGDWELNDDPAWWPEPVSTAVDAGGGSDGAS